MFIRWGEHVFVHNRTSVVWWPFLVGPVLVAVDVSSVDSGGERMFVFVTFPLVRGCFWAWNFCRPNRHLIDREAIVCSLQVFWGECYGFVTVWNFPGNGVDTVREGL